MIIFINDASVLLNVYLLKIESFEGNGSDWIDT